MKVDKYQAMCVLLGITLYVAGFFVEKQNAKLTDGYALTRGSYGQGDKEETLLVDGFFDDEQISASVRIKERLYSSEEAERAFDPAYEELLTILPGENESLDCVRTNLKFPTWIDNYGMKVEWSSDKNDVVDLYGEVFGEDCPEKGQEVFLTATLTTGKYSRDYIIKIRVFPPILSEKERKINSFYKLLDQMDTEQSTSERFLLPDRYDGKSLQYTRETGSGYWIFLPMGVLFAFMIPLKKKQDVEVEKKKRERQLLLDYSEIVSKLVVLLGAGMPVRGAWERVVCDYEKKAKECGYYRYAYEEMKNTYYLMGKGVAETRAYAEFGNRCRVLSYRKLAGILEQNVKNGTAYLRPILEAEMQDAFEQRKTLARRMGEEAGTKLLLPLFIMLVIVMVMIALPAFLSFGI